MSDHDRRHAPTGWARSAWLPIFAIGVVLFAVPLAAQLLEQPFLIRIATRVVVFSIVVVALNLILGFGGLVSLMQASLLGIGGYVVAILARHSTAPIMTDPS